MSQEAYVHAPSLCWMSTINVPFAELYSTIVPCIWLLISYAIRTSCSTEYERPVPAIKVSVPVDTIVCEVVDVVLYLSHDTGRL